MSSVQELAKKYLLKGYQDKFAILETVAHHLHKIEETELEMAVLKKMAGLKMLIDFTNGK